MKCLFLGFLPSGSEWIIIAPLVFIIYYVIYKSIRNLFKWNLCHFPEGQPINEYFGCPFLLSYYTKNDRTKLFLYELLYTRLSYTVSWFSRDIRFLATSLPCLTLSIWWIVYLIEWCTYYEYYCLLSWWYVSYFIYLHQINVYFC